MILNITDEKSCCGCMACSAVCPQKCIHMVEGTLGHLFPMVDKEQCFGCSLCENVCPMKKVYEENTFIQKGYVAYSKNKDIRFFGSSGGLFGTFSMKLLDEGYKIYGAAFDDSLKLKCVCAENEKQLKPLKKSKYLQSDVSNKFSEICEKLNSGEKIFITATPCQIAALKSYLKREYDNLITADFFCHGVPSQKLFDKCLKYDEISKYKGKIISYQFRTKKKNGSTPHYFSVEYEKNGKIKNKIDYYFKSTFYALFQKYICLRESCYECKFSGADRISDITLADFHDVDKYVAGINRFDGVSTVIVNSQKGEKLLSLCRASLHIEQLDLPRLISDGVCFSKGTKRPANRDEFIYDYENMPIENIAKKYVPHKQYIKMRIYYGLPNKVRKILKSIIKD